MFETIDYRHIPVGRFNVRLVFREFDTHYPFIYNSKGKDCLKIVHTSIKAGKSPFCNDAEKTDLLRH